MSQMPVSLVVRLCTDDEGVCDFFNRLDDEEEFRFVLLAQYACTTEYGCACFVLAQCRCTVPVLSLYCPCTVSVLGLFYGTLITACSAPPRSAPPLHAVHYSLDVVNDQVEEAKEMREKGNHWFTYSQQIHLVGKPVGAITALEEDVGIVCGHCVHNYTLSSVQ